MMVNTGFNMTYQMFVLFNLMVCSDIAPVRPSAAYSDVFQQ